MHFLKQSTNTKVLIGVTIFTSRIERRKTGSSFYVVIGATRTSSHLQCKGSTFISQLVFYDLSNCPAPNPRHPTLQYKRSYRLSLFCRGYLNTKMTFANHVLKAVSQFKNLLIPCLCPVLKFFNKRSARKGCQLELEII